MHGGSFFYLFVLPEFARAVSAVLDSLALLVNHLEVGDERLVLVVEFSHIIVRDHLGRDFHLDQVLGQVGALLQVGNPLEQPLQDWIDDLL